MAARADIYPEFGTYPGGGESPIIPFGDEKNAEREVIHGRWAMLGVTGAWAAENGTGIPWFTAGTLCTPDELTVGDVSPGGRFDPLGLAESGDLEELKIKELKHCRLSMFAWLGCIFQALATQEGPIANWQSHVADPV